MVKAAKKSYNFGRFAFVSRKGDAALRVIYPRIELIIFLHHGYHIWYFFPVFLVFPSTQVFFFNRSSTSFNEVK